MKHRITQLLLLAAVVGGCAQHEARPAFRSALYIGDRGISIPLPPPSVLEEPNVDVDVDGEIIGDDEVDAGMVVRVVELSGGAEASVELTRGATTFEVTGLPLNLTDNCIEAWIEAPATGAESDHALYRAEALDGSTVIVKPDCDD